jgi:hypothetical protein
VDWARKRCGAAIVLVLDVFFFVEEVFVRAFRLVMTTATTRATATSNWWVVGGGKVFAGFLYILLENFAK